MCVSVSCEIEFERISFSQNPNPSKKKKSRSKSARKASSSNGNFQVTASNEVILPPVSSPFKKKKLKRIRRPCKGSQPDDQN